MEEIQVFEPHPFNEAIAFSGDTSNGIVVIWDIECGIPLNVFQEFGIPVEMPSVELPILDGKWAPDGNSFAVSSLYGTFSIYGFGDPGIYANSPSQQFFLNDYDLVRIDENFNIYDFLSDTNIQLNIPNHYCDAWKNYHPQQIFCKGKNIPYKVNRFSKLSLKELDLYYCYFLETNPNRLELLYKQTDKKQIENLQTIVKLKSSKLLNKYFHQMARQLLQGRALFHKTTFKDQDNSSVRHYRRKGRRSKREQQARSTPMSLNVFQNLSIGIGDRYSNTLNWQNNEVMEIDHNSHQEIMVSSQHVTDGQHDYVDFAVENQPPQTTVAHRRPRSQRRIQNQIRRQNFLNNDSQQNFLQPTPIVRMGYRQMVNQQNAHRDLRRQRRARARNSNSNLPNRNEAYNPEDESKSSHDDRISSDEIFNPNKRRSQRIRNKEHIQARQTRRSTRNQEFNPQSMTDLGQRRHRPKDDFYDTLNTQSRREKQIKLNQQSRNMFDFGFCNTNCVRCCLVDPKISCARCRQKYHKECSLKRGFNEKNLYYCYQCYLYGKKNDPSYSKTQGESKLSKVHRWMDPINSYEKAFFPQIGDQVYYLFQAHEDFLQKYFNWMCWEQDEIVLPVVKFPPLRKATLCEVMRVVYEFPRTKGNQLNLLKIVAVYTLRIIDQDALEQQFKVKWFSSVKQQYFMIPKIIYEGISVKEFFTSQHKKLQHFEQRQNMQVPYYVQYIALLDKVGPVEPMFKDSVYKTIKIEIPKSNSEHLVSYKTLVNPWNVAMHGQKFAWKQDNFLNDSQFHFPREDRRKLVKRLKLYINHRSNRDETRPFMKSIDKDLYKDYLKHISYEIYFVKIITKLEKNVYHSLKGVLQDFQTLMYNAYNYNDQDSFIVKNSKRIYLHVSKMIKDIQSGERRMFVPLFTDMDNEEDTAKLIKEYFHSSNLLRPKLPKRKKRITAEIKIGDEIIQEKQFLISQTETTQRMRTRSNSRLPKKYNAQDSEFDMFDEDELDIGDSQELQESQDSEFTKEDEAQSQTQRRRSSRIRRNQQRRRSRSQRRSQRRLCRINDRTHQEEESDSPTVKRRSSRIRQTKRIDYSSQQMLQELTEEEKDDQIYRTTRQRRNRTTFAEDDQTTRKVLTRSFAQSSNDRVTRALTRPKQIELTQPEEDVFHNGIKVRRSARNRSKMMYH